MSFLKKIQKLPLRIRKIILFALVIIVGIVSIWVWAKVFVKGFKGFQGGQLKEEFRIPSLREKLEKDLPKLEVPGLEAPNGLPEIPGLEN